MSLGALNTDGITASPSTSAVKIPIEEKSAEIDDGYLRPDEESQEWHDFTEDWPKLSHIQRKLLLASAYMVVDSVAQLMRNCNMYVPNINYDVGPSASQFEGDEDDIESHGALGAHLLPDDQSRNRTDKDWLTSQESPNVRNWVATVDTEPRSPSNLLTTAYGLMQRGRFPVLPGREDADCVRYKRGMFSALQSTGHLDRVGYEGYRPQIVSFCKPSYTHLSAYSKANITFSGRAASILNVNTEVCSCDKA